MKRAVPILLDTLYALALALWFGLAAGLLAVAHPGPPDATLDLFVRRASGLVEAAGVTMVAVQFLLRRRYQQDRQLFIADSIRQLLTFGALLLAEFGRYSLLKPGHTITANDVAVLCQLAGAQMVVLAGVTGLTSWLLVPRSIARMTVAPDTTGIKPVSPAAPAKQQKPQQPTPQRKQGKRR